MTHQPGVYVPLRALFLVFDCIFFILAGNQEYHKSSDGLEFQPDQTSDSGVSCP